ncbi:MAG: hypothetical protein LBF83_08020 [Spirochaetaceae bacterium]|jgi:hypothetical protein|nr:hypothetical protein [Spirochaetaceae bacterium]
MKKMEHLFLGTLLVILLAMAGCDQGLGVTSGLRTLTGSVTITGDVRVGATLTAAPDFGELAGTVASLDKTYTWKRSGTGGEENGEWLPIEGASGGTYTPSAEDVANYIKVEVGVTGYKNAISGVTGDVVAENGGDDDGEGGGAKIDFLPKAYSSETAADLDNWSESAWMLTAGEYNTAYLAVDNPSGQTITVGGADAAKVTQAESGTTVTEASADGIAVTATLAVFSVDTRDLLFEGGTRSFTLNDVAVTLNVTPDTTGAALFVVTRYTDGGDERTLKTSDNTGGYDEWEPLTGAETLTRVNARTGEEADTDTPMFEKMLDAVQWVNDNAQAQTEYLLRVEKDEIDLPRIQFGLMDAANVVLRLRGCGSPKILKHGGNASAVSKGTSFDSPPYNMDTFFYIGSKNNGPFIKKTLILGDNITVEGMGNVRTTIYNSLLYVHRNAMLVMENGALLTKQYENNAEVNRSVITVVNESSKTPAADKGGRLRIMGGSITNCILGASGSLIYFEAVYSRWVAGSFYMAGGDSVTLSGNSNNNVRFGANSITLKNIQEFLTDGLSLPMAN